MKITDMNPNGMASASRSSTDSTAPSGGISNVSQSDNDKTLMNTPEPKARGYRADQLVNMAGDDSYTLLPEAPRKDKMRG